MKVAPRNPRLPEYAPSRFGTAEAYVREIERIVPRERDPLRLRSFVDAFNRLTPEQVRSLMAGAARARAGSETDDTASGHQPSSRQVPNPATGHPSLGPIAPSRRSGREGSG